jgi:hypothetical protein
VPLPCKTDLVVSFQWVRGFLKNGGPRKAMALGDMTQFFWGK